MISKLRPTASGWAVVFLGLVALSLGGCGRKGGLDRPPSPNAPASSSVPADTEAERANQPSVFNPNFGADAPPAAAKGEKKSFILDPLLDKR